MVPQRNVELDLYRHEDICHRLETDDIFAQEMYAALCNNQFFPLDTPTAEPWTCSWRYAGDMISSLRSMRGLHHEGYLDWYCSGNEGLVSDTVQEAFRELGWDIRPYPQTDDALTPGHSDDA